MQTHTENVLTAFRRSVRLMGNAFEITVVAEDESWATAKIDLAVAEIRRIESLLTTFSDDSQTNQINCQAGIAPVHVDREIFELIRRSIRISGVTDGAFDITYGSIDKRLWNFDRSMTSLPDEATAKSMVRLINYRHILLDEANSTVMLKEKGMRIGFGGIGKGYAAEMAKALLQREGIQSGIVNASGDLVTWGYQPDGAPWTIGIAHPDHAHLPFSYMNITGLAVATSGNYEKFVVIGGTKYSHTINPRTGLPVKGIKSVTIISPNAEIADAMATPVTIMGIRAGLNMINQIHYLGCIIIDDENKIYTSQNINLK
ncbi:FAD:protein FMN transferase [Chitinophaga pinensis]|uniref:FAD:protein FMN transferase n=1 Tax=Chitinophaga pinensis (strain ATCC 43595 / DSM 2588 / LMG 13176 / NBRC 15968 / NCIMB 11800 / UQM 2034) TaxID=485918 RepID=A0A979GYJ9_CHIPD|nr:FAD:protein FMN transferase [Chitinophaga pinensis]ACU63186.1 ApbE family lipoprotein [Chitinophaga pinensis DSM 2588]